MEEKEKDRGGCSVIAIACVCLLPLLPVLYVLSGGPAVWLLYHGYLSEESIAFIYGPLNWAGTHCEPLELLVSWYDSFFIPL